MESSNIFSLNREKDDSKIYRDQELSIIQSAKMKNINECVIIACLWKWNKYLLLKNIFITCEINKKCI
jgi:hypothetical protein